MDKLPLVSIVVPVYNDERVIEFCLRTLLRQSYSPKSIVIVNDGSTDGTLDIISRVAEGDSTVRFINIKHSGLTKARNIGIKEARGEIIFFGEGDAIYRRDYLTKAVDLMIKNPKIGGVCLTGGPWLVKYNFVTRNIDLENRIQRKMLEECRLEVFYAWVYWKKVLDAVGGFDEGLFQAEDKDLFLRVKKAGYDIGLINGVYWRHLRDQDLVTFMKRNYNGGKSRILYLMKHRRIIEFLRTVGLLWFILISSVFGIIYPQLYLLPLSASCLMFIYKLIYALGFGWSVVRRKVDLFVYPLFVLMRHLSSAVGTTYGLFTFLFGKIRKI